jgi:hypothetical protein
MLVLRVSLVAVDTLRKLSMVHYPAMYCNSVAIRAVIVFSEQRIERIDHNLASSLRHRVQPGSGAHPSAVLSPGIKQPRREADHSPPSSAEFKNAWSYNSVSPVRPHGVVLS